MTAALAAALAVPAGAQVLAPGMAQAPDTNTVVISDGKEVGQLHGVFIAKSCVSPQKVGDTLDCEITVGYNDDFGDTVSIQSAFDVVDPAGAATRVPPGAGNLQIVAVSGNTTAIVGGALPVNIGPGGSVLGGLPGNPTPGVVVFRQNSYVIQPGDPDPLPDQANVTVQDLCDAPGTMGCSMIPNLVQFTASTDIINPAIDIQKTANPDIICPGPPSTEVTYEFVVSNLGDVSLENVVLTDPDCGPIVGPVSGDVDNDNVLDIAEQFIDLNGNGVWDPGEPIINDNGNGVWDDTEVWTFECTANLNAGVVNTVTVSANPVGIPECVIEAMDTATVTEFPRPLADPNDAEACLGDSGQLCANPSGGLAPYTFEWTGPGGFTAATECIDVSVAGQYCVTVTDANGCESLPVCGTLTVNPPPACDITGFTAVDPGTTNEYCGPIGMASYTWSVIGNATIVGPNDQQCVDVMAGSPPPNTFSVLLSIVDTNGCESDCGGGLTVLINNPGRCCLPGPSGAACIEALDEAQCTALNGTGFTPGETCDTLPCGACCLTTPLGACIDRVSPDECTAQGGDPASYTPDVFCADIVCSGACCLLGGTCVVVADEAECNALPDSIQFFPGADCVPNPCVEDDEPGWNYVDNVITLTGDQPTYWSAATGLPATGGVAPFPSLDPGFPPGRPAMDGTNDRVLRGYVLAWAIDATAEDEIDWNHLKGEGTIVNYRDGYAWEYGSWNFQADPNDIIALGGVLPDGPGNLQIDGQSYVCAPQLLLLNFQAAGSSGFSGPRQIISGTDLTLHPVDADLRQEGDGPVTTKANFNIWNENEVKFSGTHRCITCWDQTELALYDNPNSFLLMHLQTQHGKARVDGLESQVCDVDVDFTDGPLGAHPDDVISQDAALLGVVRRLLSFDGGQDYGAAGTNLIGMGEEMGAISYDTTGVPPEGGCGPDHRATHTEKGSLCIFSNVELRWDQNGFLIQDTFISLTNDYPEDVKVQLYFINGDAPINATSPATGGGVDDFGRLLDMLQSYDPDESRDSLRLRLDAVLEELTR